MFSARRCLSFDHQGAGTEANKCWLSREIEGAAGLVWVDGNADDLTSPSFFF